MKDFLDITGGEEAELDPAPAGAGVELNVGCVTGESLVTHDQGAAIEALGPLLVCGSMVRLVGAEETAVLLLEVGPVVTVPAGNVLLSESIKFKPKSGHATDKGGNGERAQEGMCASQQAMLWFHHTPSNAKK